MRRLVRRTRLLLVAMRAAALVTLLGLTLVTGLASGQDKPTDAGQTYLKYCASCHGESGRGDGPLAKHLVQAPANLTLLAKRHGGVFPSLRVLDSIDGRGLPRAGAHGPREMPVWGTVWRTPSETGAIRQSDLERVARQQMVDLLEHLSRIQEK